MVLFCNLQRFRATALYFLLFWIFLFSVLTNLSTIYSFPSWFDEAFFANLTFNFAKNNMLTLDLIPNFNNGEVFAYGPVFFYIQSNFVKVFGLNPFVFRLVPLLSGYLTIVLLSYILLKNSIKLPYVAVFLIISLLDISFNRSLVSGRMDQTSILFIVISLYLAMFVFSENSALEFFKYIFIGMALSASFLTTPRSVFLFPSVVVFVLSCFFILFKKMKYNLLVCCILGFSVGFLAPIILWISHVGGFDHYVALYTTNGIRSHVGPSLFRSFYDIGVVAILIGLVIYKGYKAINTPLKLGLFLSFVFFSLFVNEVGPYAGMVQPFALALIILLFYEGGFHKWALCMLLFVLFIPGSIVLNVRFFDIILNWHCRDSIYVHNILAPYLNRSHIIVAPFKYFFTFNHNNHRVITYEYVKDFDINNYSEVNMVIAPDSSNYVDHSFQPVARIGCDYKKVPLLPYSYYNRSTFDEVVYLRRDNIVSP